MSTYTANVTITLRNVRVEASSEAKAEKEIEDVMYEWMDPYIPLDPDGTMIDVFGIEEDDYGDYNRRPARSGGCRSGSCKSGSCNNCKSGHGSKPRSGNGSRSTKRDGNKPPRDAYGRFVKKSKASQTGRR